MKEKIKTIFKNIIDYTLTNEFKSMVMISLFGFLLAATMWAIVVTALNNDVIDVATKQKEEYDKLEVKYEQLTTDYNRLKMWNDELYELFTTCQETTTWYEDFYYDNVDPYTGEIEGEYYE